MLNRQSTLTPLDERLGELYVQCQERLVDHRVAQGAVTGCLLDEETVACDRVDEFLQVA